LTTSTACPAKPLIGKGSPSIEVKLNACIEPDAAAAGPASAAQATIITTSRRIGRLHFIIT
jgi:hypothetical protein